MLTLIACLVFAVVGVAPDTFAGRVLRRLLVDLPARNLNATTPARVLFLVLLAIGTVALIGFARNEGAFLAAQTVPEALVWFTTFDVAAYLDMAALAWLLAATVRLRGALAVLRSGALRLKGAAIRLRGAIGSRRKRRPRVAGSKRPQSDDDERGWGVPTFA